MVSLTTWGAMPQVPPSPTLTNPDMILPDLSDAQDALSSPRLRFQPPPSPPSHLLRQSFQLAKAPPSRRSRSNSRPQTAMRMSHDGSVHFDGFDGDFDEPFDGDTTPKGQIRQADDAPQDTPRTNVMHNWQRDMERKAQEHARLGDADSANYSTSPDGAHGDSDGSGSTDDSDGRYGKLPYVADSDGDTDNEQWLEGQEELDLEAISSAALSKRAEMILANAKKRLNASPTLETLREDDGYNKTGADLRRSASTTSDLRAQMHDLKGRISSLKERAREEDMKRRSLQNLRTPSPFTAAASWDSSADQHANGSSSSSSSERNLHGMSRNSSPVEAHNGYYKNESGSKRDQYEVAEEQSSESGSDDTRILDYRGSTDTEDVGHEYDKREVDGESIYEDAPQVIAERHEDRADAFDYEHFFLHSAMGTYTRENRSQSIGSEDSVETTRPVSPIPEVPALPESALSPHRRTRSQDSISTVATFQTATEGNGSGSDVESEESNEALDQFTEQALSHHLPPRPSNQSLRSTSSSNSQLRSTGSFYSQNSSSSGQRRLRSAGSSYSPNIHSSGNSTPEVLDSTSKIIASFFSPQKERGQLTPLKQKDEDLLYALTTSVQQVCARLQNAQDDDYETKVWRRRLDAARKILDGVPNEDI
ncbi:hypothetical protein SLS58_010989 [Diplodia intermedia]|uniref:Uncharacterized protein n=1 Tax=Diplodia intermedia TaxID=856260 RepID=A0ABR3T2B3_9PEZI